MIHADPIYENGIKTKPTFSILIPNDILKRTDLTFNDKLVMGFYYTSFNIRGYNRYKKIRMGEILNLHPNSLSRSIEYLISIKLLNKIKEEILLPDCLTSAKSELITVKF